MKRIFPGIVVCILSFGLHAQQIRPFVVNSSGTSFANASGQLAFNVGEVAVSSIGNSNNRITQGFLQPENNGVSLKENKTEFSFDVYPNPFNTQLTIHSGNYTGFVEVRIIDGLGRSVYNGELKNNSVSTADLPNGIYQLLLINKEQKVLEHKTITKID